MVEGKLRTTTPARSSVSPSTRHCSCAFLRPVLRTCCVLLVAASRSPFRDLKFLPSAAAIAAAAPLRCPSSHSYSYGPKARTGTSMNGRDDEPPSSSSLPTKKASEGEAPLMPPTPPAASGGSRDAGAMGADEPSVASPGLLPGTSFTPSRCDAVSTIRSNGVKSPSAKRPRLAPLADAAVTTVAGATAATNVEGVSSKRGGRTGKRTDFLVWDDYFMSVAFLSAMRSKDPSTQVGACIVNQDKRIVGIGYNGFPMGCSDDDLPWARHADEELDTKYPYVCHAEMNAILNKNSADVKGCSIYVALFPCNECAKLIIQSGIREVVYLSDKYHKTTSMTASRRLFELSGVKCRQHVPKEEKITIDFSSTLR
ncbi:unnamed protein product [Scytosiphon promiscuus]